MDSTCCAAPKIYLTRKLYYASLSPVTTPPPRLSRVADAEAASWSDKGAKMRNKKAADALRRQADEIWDPRSADARNSANRLKDLADEIEFGSPEEAAANRGMYGRSYS